MSVVFNRNLLRPERKSNLLLDRFVNLQLYPTYNFIPESNNITFTFRAEKRNVNSLIDFFLISSSLVSSLISFSICNPPTNSSDHCPILLNLCSDALNIFRSPTHPDPDGFRHSSPTILSTAPVSASLSSTIQASTDPRIFFNFEKKYIFNYYNLTRDELYQTYNILNAGSFKDLKVTRPDLFTEGGINTLYKNFTHTIIKCSLASSQLKKKLKTK